MYSGKHSLLLLKFPQACIVSRAAWHVLSGREEWMIGFIKILFLRTQEVMFFQAKLNPRPKIKVN